MHPSDRNPAAGAGAAAPLLAARGLVFRHRSRAVLDAADLALAPGERLALVGGNGAGKSTLLQLLVGLLRPSAGSVWAFGRERREERDFHEVRARAGLLFQDSDDQLFCPTVLEDVAFGPLNLGLAPERARERALRVLADLGLGHYAERVPQRLSAGEKRLVALATVLAMEPEVLLLDEPTNGLDQDTALMLTERLGAMDEAMILVSHDLDFIERLATRAVILAEGRVVPAVMHRHPHHHTHSHLHIHPADAPDSHASPAPPHDDHHQGAVEPG